MNRAGFLETVPRQAITLSSRLGLTRVSYLRPTLSIIVPVCLMIKMHSYIPKSLAVPAVRLFRDSGF